MTIATKAARPRTTHPEHNGAYDNGAQDSGVAALDAALARLTDTDAARIIETAAALAQISETATTGIVLQTSNAAGVSVTSLMWDLTMIVRAIVRLALELFGGVATEFGRAVGFNVDDDQHADICFGDPIAWV